MLATRLFTGQLRATFHANACIPSAPQVLTETHRRDGVTLLRRCPVSGAQLSPTDHTGNFVYMLFQMDSGVGKNLQTGTFRTAAQVCLASLCGYLELQTQPTGL
jgi:hypothetical protein